MSLVPYLPETAPFSPAQRSWLNGYLAGLYSKASVDPAAMGADGLEASGDVVMVTVLYGSQTGTSEALARETGDRLKSSGCAPTVVCMGEIEPAKLAGSENLLLICSTYGDGEMPDNAQGFWDLLVAEDAPKLDGTRFSVLALGDTAYETFCTAGKELDQRFEALGAERLAPRVDCDVDFEEPYELWLENVLKSIDIGTNNKSGQSIPQAQPAWSKKNPYPSALKENRLVTREGSSKEIRHYVLNLAGSGITYEPGDALNVVPMNSTRLVDELIQMLGWDPAEPMDGGPLAEVLRRDFEIRTPAKKLLDVLRERGPKPLVEKLEDAQWMFGKDIVDLLAEAPDLQFTPGEMLPLLRGLQARAYSISSALAAHPDEVHLTIASVRYEDTRTKEGVCSCFLADHAEGLEVGVWIHPNKAFSVPTDPTKAMIMVGPGTGIAPFLGFLQQREAESSSGKNWLFFGERNQAADFLYEDELKAWCASGLLQLSTAFSRDQKEKIYVQDRMRAAGAELFAWLEDGAYFYVCGDAKRMAKDVDQTLHNIIAEHGNVDSAAYVAQLKKEKRYVRDVY